MFTGLAETTGQITGRNLSGGAGTLSIKSGKIFEELKHGESIAVNGACLTLEKFDNTGNLYFHVLEETLKRTNLGQIPLGTAVNLERALAFGDRLGGHLVTGHVDAVAPVKYLRKQAGDVELAVEIPEKLSPYLVEKGSIAIDGISLTLVMIEKDYFTVHLIPVTLAETALKDKKAGDMVNLEGDLIGKYVQRQLSLNDSGSNVNMETLRNAGW
jgi:riboflavin synthase